jgi:hypothetical protein
MDAKGHLCAAFKNSKLNIIERRIRRVSTAPSTTISGERARRSGSPTGSECDDIAAYQTATDKKYALVFYTDPIVLENVGSLQLLVSL